MSERYTQPSGRFFLPSLCLAVLCLLGGCTQLVGIQNADYDPLLISDEVVFGYAVEAPPPADLLGMSPGMHVFVGDVVDSSPYRYGRFKYLMRKLRASGHFDDTYERAATYVAAEAFDARTGNCLAYTSMFVALARAVGLNANFQIVQTPPLWDVESGMLVRNNHVNVRLWDIATPERLRATLAVDFNEVEADETAPTVMISDDFALALYYGNVAIDHLQAGELERTFAYLRLAILTEPGYMGVWNNMGTLYSVLDKPALAQKVFEHVLAREPRNKTAIAGMANVLHDLGNHSQAQTFVDATLKSRRRNPYYHYALAEQAYREELFEEALDGINTAIRLHKKNPRFYFLRAATAAALGDEALFQKSLTKLRSFKGRRDTNVLHVRNFVMPNS